MLVWEQAPRFVRNAATSLPTFLLDLGLLFWLVSRLHIDYLLATIVSFLVANGLGYFAARWLVFGETKRGVRDGSWYQHTQRAAVAVGAAIERGGETIWRFGDDTATSAAPNGCRKIFVL